MCSEGRVESQRLRSGRLAVDDWPRLTAALGGRSSGGVISPGRPRSVFVIARQIGRAHV